VRLVMATHPNTDTAAPAASQYLRYGSSPRGGQVLMLAGKVRALIEGRYNVSFEDIQYALHPALRHRLILNFEAEAEGMTRTWSSTRSSKCIDDGGSSESINGATFNAQLQLSTPNMRPTASTSGKPFSLLSPPRDRIQVRGIPPLLNVERWT